MEIIKGQETTYQEYVTLNSEDSYSKGVVTYAERWADQMERGIRNTGMDVDDFMQDHADQLSHDADTDGLTGFMYGAAVSGLAKFWIHGEALRQWHNLKTQIGDEGERANADGGTLNPALLTLGDDNG